MKILLFGQASQSSYLPTLSESLRKRQGVACDILSYGQSNLPPKSFGKIFEINYPKSTSRVLRGFFKLFAALKVIRRIPRDTYDIVNIQYLASSIVDLIIYFALLRTQRRAALVITYWGSDLNHLAIAHRTRWVQSKILERAAVIHVLQDEMRWKFEMVFGSGYRVKVARFGLPLGDSSESNDIRSAVSELETKFGIRPSEKVIVAGYSADSNQNHRYVLSEYTRLSAEMLQNSILLLPMGYGDAAYRAEIKQLVQKSGRVIVISDFLSNREVLGLRARTDVQIQAATHDGFSASVRESLIGGALLLCNARLPYQELDQIGVYYRSFLLEPGRLFTILTEILPSLAEEKKKCLGNPAKMRSYFEWDACIDSWFQVYSAAMDHNRERPEQ